ncbi:hypothetical protein B0H12DRAFT_1145051 [Mycena haematopus]|nr:hypothetical protein B0H12DRAFT_1145051 [Mycena haematopus]
MRRTMPRQRPTRPPETGVRRPRSPDPPLPSGDGDNPLGSITKSPHTARVIKRGRTSGPNSDATPAPDANQPTTTTPAPIPVFTTQDEVEAWEARVLAHFMAIQEDLVAVLATAQAFGEYADTAKVLRADTLECVTAVLLAATQIRDLLQPLEQVAPAPSTAENGRTQSPHTFAEAAKAQPDRALPRAQQPSKPKRPVPTPKRGTARPAQRITPSTRLIVDLAGSRPTKTPHPDTLCRAINDTLDGRLAVSAVSTSRNGNLVLHASAPACSAQALDAHRVMIWKTIAPLLGVANTAEPLFYPADPWHKVVFHRVPLMQPGVLPSSRDFVREVAKRNQLPGTQYRIGNVRFLHGRDSVPQAEVTVRVDFIEEEDAQRFLRDGIFLFGSHCRATRYRPRSNGGRPSGGN